MSIHLDSYLVSALALGDLCAERQCILRDMVADLLETGAFRVRGDAIRQLHQTYRTGDILLLANEAIYACEQEMVARQMSDEGLNHLASAADAALNGHPGTFEPHHQ